MGLRDSSHTLLTRWDALILLTTGQGRNTMMNLITIEEAQAKLPEIVDKLEPGEELIITRNDQPIAKLVGHWRPAQKPRQPGSAKGMLTIVSDDDEHLKDFADHMS
jgi:antitoxin (DNA-binding transcriptional repressor) of toxin-antitoxin stability system